MNVEVLRNTEAISNKFGVKIYENENWKKYKGVRNS